MDKKDNKKPWKAFWWIMTGVVILACIGVGFDIYRSFASYTSGTMHHPGRTYHQVPTMGIIVLTNSYDAALGLIVKQERGEGIMFAPIDSVRKIRVEVNGKHQKELYLIGEPPPGYDNSLDGPVYTVKSAAAQPGDVGERIAYCIYRTNALPPHGWQATLVR